MICFFILSMVVFSFNNAQAYPQGEGGMGGMGATNDHSQHKVDMKELEAKANTGDPVAQFQLGVAYYDNNDANNALKWFKESAKQGHAYAHNNIAVIYAQGDAVNQDLISAYGYALAAYQLDESLSEGFIKDLESIMSLKQISEGKKFAKKVKSQIK